MNFCSRAVSFLFAVALLAGCASTNVTQQTPMAQPGLARPNRIWVYNFVADPADMPADSSIRGDVGAPSTPPTAAQIAEGRQLGATYCPRIWWRISMRWDLRLCRQGRDLRHKSAMA